MDSSIIQFFTDVSQGKIPDSEIEKRFTNLYPEVQAKYLFDDYPDIFKSHFLGFSKRLDTLG